MKTLAQIQDDLLWVATICFIGVCAAYVALWRTTNDKISVIAEGVSIFALTNIAVGWLGFARGWIDASKTFHH